MDRTAVAHTLAAVATGAIGAITAVVGAVLSLAADAPAQDLAPYVSGAGSLTAASALALIVVKLSRGELVARDPAKVEAALLRLVDEYKESHGEVKKMADGQQQLLREVLTAVSSIDRHMK